MRTDANYDKPIFVDNSLSISLGVTKLSNVDRIFALDVLGSTVLDKNGFTTPNENSRLTF